MGTYTNENYALPDREAEALREMLHSVFAHCNKLNLDPTSRNYAFAGWVMSYKLMRVLYAKMDEYEAYINGLGDAIFTSVQGTLTIILNGLALETRILDGVPQFVGDEILDYCTEGAAAWASVKAKQWYSNVINKFGICNTSPYGAGLYAYLMMEAQ